MNCLNVVAAMIIVRRQSHTRLFISEQTLQCAAKPVYHLHWLGSFSHCYSFMVLFFFFKYSTC